MKSNQINFFILPEDLIAFERILLEHGTLFIKQPIYDLNDIYIQTIQHSKVEGLFNKIYLTTKEFQENVVIEKVEKQPYHLVNVLLSDVIEFSLGGFLFSSNKLERGRFYYIYSYFENNIAVGKSSEFKKWADSIFSSVKKDALIKNNPKNIYYLSRNVKDWMVSNNADVHESGLYITAY